MSIAVPGLARPGVDDEGGRLGFGGGQPLPQIPVDDGVGVLLRRTVLGPYPGPASRKGTFVIFGFLGVSHPFKNPQDPHPSLAVSVELRDHQMASPDPGFAGRYTRRGPDCLHIRVERFQHSGDVLFQIRTTSQVAESLLVVADHVLEVNGIQRHVTRTQNFGPAGAVLRYLTAARSDPLTVLTPALRWVCCDGYAAMGMLG